jgi:hypothetical protein
MSKSNEVNNLPISLTVGSPIVPFETGRLGNAVIFDITMQHVTVVTDFGNTIKYSHAELRDAYGEPIWASEHRLYYGTNHDPLESLRERFRTQVDLLTDVLGSLI